MDLIFQDAYEAKKPVPYTKNAELKYIIMDIETYNGPRLDPNLPPTYCCFGTFRCSSEKHRGHYREGFPIVQGKSDTIHSAQGLSVGKNEFLKCMVLDSWESQWENRWPGLFYVGSSRACEKGDIYIQGSLCKRSLRGIGSGDTWNEQNNVCKEIEKKAIKERKKDLQNGVGTEEDFQHLYAWFIETMKTKMSNWQPSDDEIETKKIIQKKLDTYQKDFKEEFNATPNRFNVRRSLRSRRQTTRLDL